MRNVTVRIFILGRCVALRIKNWQFEEGCILHNPHASAMVVITIVRMLSGSS